MNRRVMIIGVILLAISASLIILGRIDLPIPGLGQSNIPSNGDQSTTEYFLADNTNMGAIYSALTTVLIISPGGSQSTQDFTIHMNLRFLDIAPAGCVVNQLCEIQGVGGILPLDTSITHIIPLTVTESALPIPLVMTGSNLGGLGNYEYLLTITSVDDFTFTHQETISWRILVPVGLLLSLISVFILVIGLIRGQSKNRTKPLPQQPAFEPVLGGGSRTSAGSGRSSKRSKKQSKQSRGTSSASTSAGSKSSSMKCRSCNLPIPRDSQYCPHCYTRQ